MAARGLELVYAEELLGHSGLVSDLFMQYLSVSVSEPVNTMVYRRCPAAVEDQIARIIGLVTCGLTSKHKMGTPQRKRGS